ncbi:MAG: O-antigen ligase family protein [Patescibacteria group bacterium]
MPSLIWLLLASLLFIYLAYYRLSFGVAVILVLLPSYLWRWQFFGLPSTFLEIMIWLLFLVWLLKDQRFERINFYFQSRAENVVPGKWRYLLLAWLLVSIIGLVVHPSFHALGLWRAYWLEPMMFFMVFMYVVRKSEDTRMIIRASGLLVLWLFFVAAWQKYGFWYLPPEYNYPNTIRLTSIFSYPNALSLLTAPLTSFFAGLYLITKKNNLFYLVLTAMGVMLSVWAVSQGALAGIITALVVWCLVILWNISYKKFGKYNFGAWLVLGVAILVLVWQSNAGQSFRQQLFKPELNLQASSLEIRSSQWQETWQMLRHNFIFGAGINGYQAAMGAYHKVDWLEIYLYPHNVFLNFWSEVGFLGLLVFLLCLFFIVQDLLALHKVRHWLAWPLTLAWLTWFTQGLVDVPYFKNDLSILFFALLAFTILSKNTLPPQG